MLTSVTRDGMKYSFDPVLSDENIAAINELRRALNPESRLVDPVVIASVQRSGCLLVAHTIPGPGLPAEIAAIATLNIFCSLARTTGHIDDVIVGERFRKRGIGRTLMEVLIQRARGLGIHQLELTSQPGRAEAIALYESLGFKKRETNVFRLPL